jgi:hypothetical protein
MTGSGKTGLGCVLLEEAALDGIPALVLDPKGDLTNLLLTFPELRPEDFGPWVNEEDARNRGLSVPDYAAQQAARWRQGLADWDQDGDRIRRLQAAADIAVYTPGSSVGIPLSLLKSFAVPPPEIREDGERLRERVLSTVLGLLGLVGIQADPLKSREVILLSHLVQQAWAQERDLDLGALIQELQQPSVNRIGVLDLESFYPAKDRFDLAVQLNHLLGSPFFASWREGAPLDIGQLLHGRQGRPRLAILSLAHLGEAERMFFVTLLLTELLGWMRTQSGTNSLRALLYMDEIFGYFPPVANPPAKLPLLTLLKQARAFGLGVVLATQNPVDLDYKGLANIGTWFIGRLQTERDQARVLEGLAGAAASHGAASDPARLGQILAGLAPRVFLLHRAQEADNELFQVRWTLSYLRGPLTRAQLKALTEARRTEALSTPAAPAGDGTAVGVGPVPPWVAPPEPAQTTRPILPPEVPQVFAPLRAPLPAGASLVYQPRLLGSALVRFVDPKAKVDVSQEVTVMTEIGEGPIPVDWAAAEELAISARQLETTPAAAEYTACAPAASQVKNYALWAKDFTNWLASERKFTLYRSPALGLTSEPGEAERDFRIRLQQAAREQRDAAAEKLRQKYAPRLATLNERLRRAEAAREREAEQAKRAKFDTVVSLGSTLLGAFLGRKAVSASTVGRAATTMRSAGRAYEQSADVGRAGEGVDAIRQQLEALDAEFRAETEALAAAFDPATAPLETVELRPKRTHIQVRLVALVWLPFSRDRRGVLEAEF